MPKTEDKELEIMALCNVKAARAFHESFRQYKVTPLAELKELAKFYGIKDLFIKDESYRFGLNAFKVLGGSYAMARYIAKADRPADVSGAPLRRPHLPRAQEGDRPGHLLHRHRRQPRPGRCLGGATSWGRRRWCICPRAPQKARFDNIAQGGAQVTTSKSSITTTACAWRRRGGRETPAA